MKLALDATPLVTPTGGIRRYTIELAKALRDAFPDDHHLLVSDQSYQHPEECAGIESRAGSGGRWWSLGLPRLLRRERVDVFHGTDFAVPYAPVCPAVMTVHDLSPWRYPGPPRVRRRTPWLLRLGLATMVITPSEAVRSEVIEHFRLSPEEVKAAPLAASPHFRPIVAPPPARPYFLCVGTLEERKNIGTIVDAWRAVKSRHAVGLVLAGIARPGFSVPEAEPGLSILGEVAEAELPRWYSQAVAAVCPSEYEGFGLPVLEAMQCGSAVISSRDPAIVEIAGGAAQLVGARDTRGWVAAMNAVLENAALRGELRARSLERARAFSWRRTAEITRDVYHTAMRRFHG